MTTMKRMFIRHSKRRNTSGTSISSVSVPTDAYLVDAATDNAKRKRQCIANNGTVNHTPPTNSTMRNYSAAGRIGKASRKRRAIVGNAARIVDGIDTS
jgi:hypothetical protein